MSQRKREKKGYSGLIYPLSKEVLLQFIFFTYTLSPLFSTSIPPNLFQTHFLPLSLNNHQSMSDYYSNLKDGEVSTGTTIVAFKYKDGVVIAADSRTSSGVYVVNRVTDKLTKLTEKIYCLRSGSAADTQYAAEMVSYYLAISSTEEGKEPEVKTAASLFRNFLYKYKNYLTAAIIVAGYDDNEGASIYSLPLGGTMLQQEYAIGGSGSSYIYGFCDANYREGMDRDEAVEFAKKAVNLAIVRDGSSGGIVRVALITREGVERLTYSGDELDDFM